MVLRNNPETEEEKPPVATPQDQAEEDVAIEPPLRVPKPTSSRMDIGGGIGKTALVSFVVAALVIILMGMMGGGSFVTKKDFETNMANMAVSVNEAVASVNTAVQALPDTVSSTVNSAISQQTSAINKSISEMGASVLALSAKMDESMADLDAKITEMQTQMADYEDRIATLETAKEEEEEAATAEEDTVRWNFEDVRIIHSTNPLDDIKIVVDDIDPRRIEEEGLYEIQLLIFNQGQMPWDMVSIEIKLVLEPREYCPVNEDDTYIDSDDYPWLSWDADFVMKTREGQEVCRRIEFTSDRYNFATTLAPDEYYELDLVLELYYK